MTLNQELYTIVSTDSEALSFKVRLNPESLIYKAHFPGQPITPGVCIMQIATELLSAALGRQLSIRTVGNAKFLAVIDPRCIDEITYQFKKLSVDGDTVKVSVQVSDDNTVYSKLSLLLS